MTHQYCDIMGCHAPAKWKCACNYPVECLEEYLCDFHMGEAKRLHATVALRYDALACPVAQDNSQSSRETICERYHAMAL